jgi:hypothetical protein
MERVGQSVLMYSFVKDGQARGERIDASASVIAAGQTIRMRLQEFMYEDKKGGSNNVFPTDASTIPPFSVVEIMLNPANQGGFEQGYGLVIARVRPCDFTLYSMQTPLGLGLLPPTYEAGVAKGEAWAEANQGLKRVLEDKNIGFFGRVTTGSYLIRSTHHPCLFSLVCDGAGRYNEDYRLVGPKETPADPQSRHLNVMDGGVFAVDIKKEDLLRFTNAGEAEEEDGLVYAQFIVEFAAASGALDCYVTHNEYLLRNDPNRSPFTGAPLIDTNRLLECVRAEDITGVVGQRFPLPFEFAPLERPFLTLEPVQEEEPGAPLACSDLVLASENAHPATRSYMLTLGDATEEDIMRFLFVPKSASSAGNSSLGGRQDYRMLSKKRKAGE